jgi:hypothetical protein
LHRLTSHFVLGYHGCDASIAERLITGEAFDKSENDYDWLGPGIYFWEANPRRGLDWANEASGRPKSGIKVPAVVGAIIDLGQCLDLMAQGAIEIVLDGYNSLRDTLELVGKPLPTNGGGTGLVRRLDCAVINRVHSLLGEGHLDTVRGVFVEGDPIYPGAGFDSKTHIQICVCNPRSIKGVFRVPAEHLSRTSV